MCVAKEYSSILIKLYEEIEHDYQRYCEEQSEYDKSLNNMLHKLESETFSASTGYKMAKEIKEIMMRRRIVKNEVEALTSLRQQINYIKPTNIKTKIAKIEEMQSKREYTPRKTKIHNKEDN